MYHKMYICLIFFADNESYQEVFMTKKKTRLLTVGMAMIVLLAAALFAIPRLNTTASALAWDGTVADDFAGGSGKSDAPYQIANGEQLAYLAKQVNDGNAFSGVYFELTALISTSAARTAESGRR